MIIRGRKNIDTRDQDFCRVGKGCKVMTPSRVRGRRSGLKKLCGIMDVCFGGLRQFPPLAQAE